MSEHANSPSGQSIAQPPVSASGGASPVAAAAVAAGIGYGWAEMIFRYAFTHSPSFNSDYYILWNGRPGDVASMWLTILIIEAIVFFVLAWLWRRRERVGSLRVWTIVLLVSAIAAPMLGELGTPASGTISPHTTDVIAWVVTVIAVILGAAALAWPRLSAALSKGSASHLNRP